MKFKKEVVPAKVLSKIGQERYIKSLPMNKQKQCYAMVGLPARGKSYTAHRLARYLNWIGVKSKVFNVGTYRRDIIGANMSCDFYNPDNPDGTKARWMVAMHVVDKLITWFKEDEEADVAILDATNTTRQRREMILKKCTAENISVMFIESVLEDVDIEKKNIKEHKVLCPDYIGCDPDTAFTDFSARIDNYKKAYETLSLHLDRELSFIRIYNISQFHINNLTCNVQSKSAYFLMNIRSSTKPTLYFSRHGESHFNSLGRIGGDSNLSTNGVRYAQELGKYLERNNLSHIPVWTSLMKRTIETCSHLPNTNVQMWKALNEIDAGRCDGLTYEEIEKRYPEEFVLRDLDKFKYRYPRGESYHDMCCRLEPIIMELEKQTELLVVCHQAVLRCIVGYYLNVPLDKIPYIKIPLHTIIKITPVAYGCEMEEVTFDIESCNTHRDMPTPENIEARLTDVVQSRGNSECGDNDGYREIIENGHRPIIDDI